MSYKHDGRVDMRDIKERYQEVRPDGHWFDPDTMRFFKTVLPACGYRKGGDVYFITSKTGPSGKSYSVRLMDWSSGKISTAGEFHGFPDRASAEDYMKACMK